MLTRCKRAARASSSLMKLRATQIRSQTLARPPGTAAAAFSTAPERVYFYTVNDSGFLFLEEVKMRNFTTALKDPKFLDFFFSRIVPLRTVLDKRPADLPARVRTGEFPFVSLCGRELNFIKPDTTPIVFRDIEHGRLTYAATLSVPFVPGELRLLNGKLFHPLPASAGSWGLLRSALTMQLEAHVRRADGSTAAGFSRGDADASAGASEASPTPVSGSVTDLVLHWQGLRHPLSALQSDALPWLDKGNAQCGS